MTTRQAGALLWIASAPLRIGVLASELDQDALAFLIDERLVVVGSDRHVRLTFAGARVLLGDSP